MIDSRKKKVLQLIAARLNDPNETAVNWVVTGSLGMVLNGMEMDVHDIDLQTDQAGAYEIERRLTEYRISPVIYKASERIHSYFGVFEVEGIQVEVMGDMQHLLPNQTWQAPINIEKFRKWIELKSVRIPVMSLEHEVEAYRLMGRFEKAERVHKFLLERKGG